MTNEHGQIKDYETIKQKARDFYSSYEKVSCPALGNEYVHFTAEGFNHLIYKGKKKERDQRVQKMKFDLLEKAYEIIEVSTTFQEYEESYEFIKIQKYGKKSQENRLIKCWGFVAMIRKFRVKVVVRQVGNGKKEFYSVIPAWYTRQYRDIKIIETSTAGGLLSENDDETLKNATE
jgi:hypothetical protein